MRSLGFHFRETMRGTYYRVDAPAEDRPIEIALTVETTDVARFARDRTWTVVGHIDADGLASHRAVDGTLEMRLFDERRLPYRVRFTGDDGAAYELRGQKELLPIAPVESLTVLPASIYDESGEEIARTVLRFDARHELGMLVRSLRVAFA